MVYYLQNILTKITENIEATQLKGIIIASPSDEPDYKYHWVRDSALVMRPFLTEYNISKQSKNFHTIINYLEIESKLQDLSGESGLGEPKFEIDCSPYTKEWGSHRFPDLRSRLVQYCHDCQPTFCKPL